VIRLATRNSSEGLVTCSPPTGCLHRVSKNPSDKNKTRVPAVALHAQDVKDIVIPEKKKD
jgi:hypothetical protein